MATIAMGATNAWRSYYTRSGVIYTADVFGNIVLSAPSDIKDLVESGGVRLYQGQAGPGGVTGTSAS